MTPEKEINKQIWSVLQDVKKQWLRTRKDKKAVKCRLPNFKSAKTILINEIEDILYNLEEKGAFVIQRNAKGQRITNRGKNAFYLIINPPRFDEVYEEYEQKNKPSYQIDYSDDNVRREWEKKWEIIKTIYSHYFAEEEPKHFTIALADFKRGIVQKPTDVTRFCNAFQTKGCFTYRAVNKELSLFEFREPNTELITETYNTIHQQYKKFGDNHDKRHPKENKLEHLPFVVRKRNKTRVNTYGEQPITFGGRRGNIIHFTYQKREQEIMYEDFKKSPLLAAASPKDIRQDVMEINKRFKKETGIEILIDYHPKENNYNTPLKYKWAL